MELVPLTPTPHGSVCGCVLCVEMVNKTQMHTLVILAADHTEVKPHHLGAFGTGSGSYMESVLG